MKRTFFNPARMSVVRSRRIFGSTVDGSFRSAAYKSQGDNEDPEEAAAKEALLKEVQTRTKSEMDTRGWTEPFKKSVGEMVEGWKTLPLEAIRSLSDPKEGVMAKLATLEAAFEKMENGSEGGDGKRLSIRAQIANWQKNAGIDKEGNWRKNKKELPEFELDLRAAAVPMLPSNTLNSSAYLPVIDFDWTLNDIPRNKLTFWDYLQKGRTNSAAYGWVNKTNPQGAAGFIGPGVLKPYISFEVETFISTPRKVAALDKVATELLEDIDAMESWIKDELRYQVLLVVNTKLMTGTGSATEPTGIQALSVAFTGTGLGTTNPTYADALRSVVAQMRAGNLAGDITIFINPIDGANMDMAKASISGVYQLPPFMTANGRTIAGATIVEDNNITIGHFQAAMLRYYVIKIYKPLVIDWGYENDDFTKNLVTYRAEMRIHQMFNEQYQGAFVYDTFANVLAAIDITPVPTP